MMYHILNFSNKLPAFVYFSQNIYFGDLTTYDQNCSLYSGWKIFVFTPGLFHTCGQYHILSSGLLYLNLQFEFAMYLTGHYAQVSIYMHSMQPQLPSHSLLYIFFDDLFCCNHRLPAVHLIMGFITKYLGQGA